MALFTVAVFKRRFGTPSDLFARLTAVAHLHPRSVVEQTIKTRAGTIYLQALRTPTGFYSEDDQTNVTPFGSVLLNGYAYAYDKEEPEILSAAALAKGFAVSRFDDLAGEYAVAHVAQDGKITALADPDGMQNLFYIDTKDVFAVSTRPAMLAALTGDRVVDLHSLAWISAIGYRVGEGTAYRDVKAVPQGKALVWDGRLSFLDRHTPLNRDHSEGLDAHPKWLEDQLERGIAAAGRAVQLACKGKDKIDLAISGGKDSRMVLALCLAAGLRDRLTLYTNGPPEHPDVIVGKMIAEAIGVPHRMNVPGPISASFQEAPEFMNRIASFAYQADGLTGSWDNFLTLRSAQNVRMSGHMGEVLKAYAKRPFDPSKKPIDPIELVKLQAPFDPMGVMLPEARQSLSDDLAARLDTFRMQGFSTGDLPDVYYYTNRIPNWLGGLRQVHPYAHETVMPIGVPPLMRMAYVATAHERKIEKIHYEIIRRLAPDLVDLPFAMQTWHSDLGARDVPMVDMAKGSAVPFHGSWHYSVNHKPVIREEILGLVNDTASSRFWTIIDADKLVARLKGPAIGMMELISLLGILPSLMFETGRFTPAKIETPGSPLPMTPYAWPKPEPFSFKRWLRGTASL